MEKEDVLAAYVHWSHLHGRPALDISAGSAMDFIAQCLTDLDHNGLMRRRWYPEQRRRKLRYWGP